MTVYEAIQTRKSIRSYLPRAVEPEKLERIFKAVRLAPSAKNFQEWRFVVVQEEETRKRLMPAAANQAFIAQAPVVIACCAETDHYVMKCGLQCYTIDIAIAIDHLTLAAVEEGLGTCWLGSFSPDRVREILGIPEDIEVVEMLTLGYPADPSRIEKNRLTVETIVHREKW